MPGSERTDNGLTLVERQFLFFIGIRQKEYVGPVSTFETLLFFFYSGCGRRARDQGNFYTKVKQKMQ